MTSQRARVKRSAFRAAQVATAAVLLSGCSGLLDVDERGIIDFDELNAAGPASVATIVNGVVGNYQEMFDDVVRYTSLFTDEMISAGTFETRTEVDRRRIDPSNATLTGTIYTGLHVARMQADTAVALLQERLADPAYDSVETEVREGIALSKLYAGYSRLWLGELYCWSILTGMFPEPAPIPPNSRVLQGRLTLLEAEAAAGPLGLDDVRLAAVVGQARAQLWLGNYAAAATLAQAVPRGFTYWADYSYNDPEQYNEMYTFSWGEGEGVQWTVGDGTTATRGGERFEHFDAFVGLNLIEVEPEGYVSFTSSIPVMLQQLYRRPDAQILMASGVEAQLIRAEADVRAGQTASAQALLNDLRADYSFRATVQWGVEPPDSTGALQPLTLSGDLETDVKTVADERARELWLTGDRFTTARRLRRDASLAIDLFPPVKTGINGGDDIAFPMVELELDANPILAGVNACPAGQAPGSWR
jgi:hypothetical protein